MSYGLPRTHGYEDMTIEERKNIEHALRELTSNKIHIASSNGHWFGNKKEFIARHKQAIAYFEKLLEGV
jgi:hypothetical protein